jgi:hypothetical protein
MIIILQTIFEAFIVLLIFLKMLMWAYNETDERYDANYYILTGSQGVLIV